MLAESHPDVVLAKVDATEESALSERYGIDGFPTLKWISGEEEIDYSGGRTAFVSNLSCLYSIGVKLRYTRMNFVMNGLHCREAIVKWVTKMTGPATKLISTVDELKAAESSADAIVVAYFAADTPEDDPALSEFVATARMDVNDIFYQTSEAAVAEAASATLGSFSVVTNFKVFSSF